jgi:hypothetical protein
MKPLNTGSDSCSPISSSCIIWQGPDIACISLCKGDTINAVVYNLAVELCKMMENFNLTNYDLTCLNLVGCDPKDFQALIQLLIDKICELQDCCDQSTTGARPAAGCPDCVVDICEAFWYTSPTGDTITTMQLTDYVKAIGNRVCSIVQQINIINATLISLDNRVTVLENAPPPSFDLPLVTPQCVLTSVPTPMNIVLTALEQQFCALIIATGSSSDIFTALTFQCPNLSLSPQLGGPGTMGQISGWSNDVQNLADSITNMWLTICDLRAAVINIQENCCPSGCSGINIIMNATLSGTVVRIYVTGTLPSNFVGCPPSGNASFTITDENGLVRTFSGLSGYDIVGNINTPTGLPFDLSASGLDLNTNLTIQMTPCFYDPETETTCQYQISYVVASSVPCPVLIPTSTTNSINFAASITSSATATYTVELYTVSPLVLISTTAQLLTGPTSFIGTFNSLVPNTTYKLRIVITTAQGTNECVWVVIATLPDPCPPISNPNATITVLP